jgi:hypothetical protein
MTEKTTKKEDGGKRGKKENVDSSAEKCKPDEQGNWSEDQRNKSYYYDDSYGYEIYNADEDDEAESD